MLFALPGVLTHETAHYLGDKLNKQLGSRGFVSTPSIMFRSAPLANLIGISIPLSLLMSLSNLKSTSVLFLGWFIVANLIAFEASIHDVFYRKGYSEETVEAYAKKYSPSSDKDTRSLKGENSK